MVCKTHQKAIRSNTYDRIPRDEWEIIEDCHEAIVSREEWDRVQKMLDGRGRQWHEKRSPFENIYSGLLYCADCGKYMTPKYEFQGRSEYNRLTKKKREPMDHVYFCCSTYVRHGKDTCERHHIEARVLHEILLKDIKAHAESAVSDPDKFYSEIVRRVKDSEIASAPELRERRQELVSRSEELDAMYFNLYQDKSKGILTEKRFVTLSGKIDEEQRAVNEELASLEKELEQVDSQLTKVDQFLAEIRKYADITELTDEILHKLIRRIEIGKEEKINGETVQRIKIIYSFVGEIDSDAQTEYLDGNYYKRTVRAIAG